MRSSIGVAFIGLAVAISIVGAGVTEPAVAKVRKSCRSQQISQTGECNDVIIENLDRGINSKGPFYRSHSQRAKKHPQKHDEAQRPS